MAADAKIAWRNIWRNPRRTLLTLGAIAFASLLLVFMLSFQFGSYDTMINTAVKINTGHLQIQTQAYHKKHNIRSVVADPEPVARVLEKIPRIQAYAPRCEAFGLVSSAERTYGILVTGIDPGREAGVSRLPKLIRQGVYLGANATDQALIGALLAQNLKVSVGDELTVLGQGRDGSVAATVVTVAGIYRAGIDAFDRSSMYIPLKTFQSVFSMRQGVHTIVVLGDDLAEVSKIKRDIRKGLADAHIDYLQVYDWDELMPGLRQAIEMDLVSGLIFYALLVLVVGFSILNTFLMAVFERTREFGVMMAIGTTPRRLTKLLLIESGAMTGIGILAGILLGVGVTWYFQVHGFELGGSSDLLSQFGISGRIYPKLSVASILIGPGLVLFITFWAALYPALKVRGLEVIQALRTQ